MNSKGGFLIRAGLLKRKERNCPTARGWGLLFLLMLLALAFVACNLNTFLSPVDRVPADVLVVEGWVPDYAFPQAVQEFRSRHYRLVIATGGPIEKGLFVSNYGTYARLSAATLLALGIGKDSVLAVPAPFIKKDRTYESAVALREWIDSTGIHLQSFNIFTLGAHGRRTHLLFQEAFGAKEKIGIISAVDLSFNPDRWWTSSQGFRTVMGEALAYVYARFLFYPPTYGR